MIEKILVPHDGSVHANHALSYALDLADKYSAEIQLLNVIPPIVIPTYSFHTVTVKGLEECNKRLEAGFSGVLASQLTAKLEKIDIIVMGSRGLSHREYGSVSQNVVNKASCPVLIVK